MRLLIFFQPLIDHLYIYQLLEYQTKDLLLWFVRHPFKRQLQKKQHLQFTLHIKILLILSLLGIGIASYFLSAGFFSFLLFFILLLQISPLFIVFSEILFRPLEIITRYRIVSRATKKRISLSHLITIGIVGSYAKTSTKNMLYTLLWKDFVVVKTPKSYNTELSIARSIMSDIKATTEVFIVEMDAYHPGEIENLCKIARPTIGIITAIGPQHLERFGSMEKLAKTQMELGDFLSKRERETPVRIGKTTEKALFLNEKDEWSQKLTPKKEALWYNNSDYKIENRKEYDSHQTFTLQINLEKGEIHLPLKGEHNAINFLAAARIAHYLGLPFKTIQKRALLIQPTEHRLEIRQMGNTTILDNTYNANPKAAQASLQLLRSYTESQKIIITPGFVELGKEHDHSHQEFGKEMAKIADDVIIVGNHAKKPLKKGLLIGGMEDDHIHFVENTAQGLAHIQKIAQKQLVCVLLENDLPDQYF